MEQSIIWIRQPRTGGTSLKWFLLTGKKEADDKIIKNPDSFNKEKEGKYLTTKPSYTKIVMIETNHDVYAVKKFKIRYPDFFRKSLKFTIVRNPWDKFVSGWKYCHTTKNRPFEDVVKNPPTKEESIHDWNHLTRPQIISIIDKNGDLLVDEILYFENLERDVSRILENFGIDYEGLPILRKTNHLHYRKYYNEETKNIIAKRYEMDIDYFGYSF